jgi:hypothetical protein
MSEKTRQPYEPATRVYEEEERRKRQEEERKKQKIKERSEQTYRTPTMSRRGFLKLAVIGGAIAVTGLGFSSFFPKPTEIITKTVDRSYTTPTIQTTRGTTSVDIYEEAKSWPLRETLQELKDVQKETKSRSQYILPEYSLSKDLPHNVESKHWADVTSEEAHKLFNWADSVWATIDKIYYTVYLNTDRNRELFTYMKTIEKNGKIGGFNWPYGLETMLRTWDPYNDPDDMVLIKDISGYYRKIIRA